eukprot:852979_1
MEQFLVLSNSHKGNKIIDDVIKEVSNDLSNYSPRAQWMIPHQIARTKLISAIFYDFIIYESLLKPYKHTSTIMYKSNKQNKIQKKKKQMIQTIKQTNLNKKRI